MSSLEERLEQSFDSTERMFMQLITSHLSQKFPNIDESDFVNHILRLRKKSASRNNFQAEHMATQAFLSEAIFQLEDQSLIEEWEDVETARFEIPFAEYQLILNNLLRAIPSKYSLKTKKELTEFIRELTETYEERFNDNEDIPLNLLRANAKFLLHSPQENILRINQTLIRDEKRLEHIRGGEETYLNSIDFLLQKEELEKVESFTEKIPETFLPRIQNAILRRVKELYEWQGISGILTALELYAVNEIPTHFSETDQQVERAVKEALPDLKKQSPQILINLSRKIKGLKLRQLDPEHIPGIFLENKRLRNSESDLIDILKSENRKHRFSWLDERTHTNLYTAAAYGLKKLGKEGYLELRKSKLANLDEMMHKSPEAYRKVIDLTRIVGLETASTIVEHTGDAIFEEKLDLGMYKEAKRFFSNEDIRTIHSAIRERGSSEYSEKDYESFEEFFQQICLTRQFLGKRKFAAFYETLTRRFSEYDRDDRSTKEQTELFRRSRELIESTNLDIFNQAISLSQKLDGFNYIELLEKFSQETSEERRAEFTKRFSNLEKLARKSGSRARKIRTDFNRVPNSDSLYEEFLSSPATGIDLEDTLTLSEKLNPLGVELVHESKLWENENYRTKLTDIILKESHATPANQDEWDFRMTLNRLAEQIQTLEETNSALIDEGLEKVAQFEYKRGYTGALLRNLAIVDIPGFSTKQLYYELLETAKQQGVCAFQAALSAPFEYFSELDECQLQDVLIGSIQLMQIDWRTACMAMQVAENMVKNQQFPPISQTYADMATKLRIGDIPEDPETTKINAHLRGLDIYSTLKIYGATKEWLKPRPERVQKAETDDTEPWKMENKSRYTPIGNWILANKSA